MTFSISLLYLCSFRFAGLTKGVEGRLRAQGPPVAPGLPADPLATRGHGDGDLIDAEGRGLRSGAPHGARSDLLLGLDLGLALGLRRVDPEDLRLLAAPLLLRVEVVDGPAFLHSVQSLHVGGVRGPRGVAVRTASGGGTPHVRRRIKSSLDGPGRADETIFWIFRCRWARDLCPWYLFPVQRNKLFGLNLLSVFLPGFRGCDMIYRGRPRLRRGW